MVVFSHLQYFIAFNGVFLHKENKLKAVFGVDAHNAKISSLLLRVCSSSLQQAHYREDTIVGLDELELRKVGWEFYKLCILISSQY